MLSALIIGIFMICASIIHGRYILKVIENSETGTYQVIKVDEKNILLLDTRTGQYWKKPILEKRPKRRQFVYVSCETSFLF
jgi:hypothetical protein